MPQKHVRRLALLVKDASVEDLALIFRRFQTKWSNYSWIAVHEHTKGALILAQNHGGRIDALRSIRYLTKEFPEHLKEIRYCTAPGDKIILKTNFRFQHGIFQKAGQKRDSKKKVDSDDKEGLEEAELDGLQQTSDDQVVEECRSLMYGMLMELETEDHNNNPQHVYAPFSCEQCFEEEGRQRELMGL